MRCRSCSGYSRCYATIKTCCCRVAVRTPGACPSLCAVCSVGACCMMGSCTEGADEADCTAVGGTYLGDGTSCSSPGDCCVAAGLCVIDPTCAGGTPGACGSLCSPCGGAIGACCSPGGGCVEGVSLAVCESSGGSYMGDGTFCADEGDCCDSSNSCIIDAACSGGTAGPCGVICSPSNIARPSPNMVKEPN